MSAGIPLIVSGIESGIYEGIYNKKNSPEDLCISFVELAGLSEARRRNISMINKKYIKQKKHSTQLEVKNEEKKLNYC